MELEPRRAPFIGSSPAMRAAAAGPAGELEWEGGAPPGPAPNCVPRPPLPRLPLADFKSREPMAGVPWQLHLFRPAPHGRFAEVLWLGSAGAGTCRSCSPYLRPSTPRRRTPVGYPSAPSTGPNHSASHELPYSSHRLRIPRSTGGPWEPGRRLFMPASLTYNSLFYPRLLSVRGRERRVKGSRGS
jgi:hypothetical protein